MDRRKLARIAFTEAADRLYEQFDARQISGPEARAKLAKLRSAYERRKSAIDLADWLAARGLTNIVRIAA